MLGLVAAGKRTAESVEERGHAAAVEARVVWKNKKRNTVQSTFGAKIVQGDVFCFRALCKSCNYTFLRLSRHLLEKS